MSAHTPGPWRREQNRRGQWEVFGATESIVCRVANWTQPIDDANARLIAAGPDLIAALKATHQQLLVLSGRATTDAWRTNVAQALLAAEAALAKAEGAR